MMAGLTRKLMSGARVQPGSAVIQGPAECRYRHGIREACLKWRISLRTARLVGVAATLPSWLICMWGVNNKLRRMLRWRLLRNVCLHVGSPSPSSSFCPQLDCASLNCDCGHQFMFWRKLAAQTSDATPPQRMQLLFIYLFFLANENTTLTLDTVELQRPCQLSVLTRRLPRDDNQPGADGAAIGPESNYPDCLEHSQATTPQLGVTAEGSRVTLTD